MSTTPYRPLPSWMNELSCTDQIEKSKEFIYFEGNIKFTEFESTLASYAEEILAKVNSDQKSEIVYGFDMEWPVSSIGASGKTALIQICTDHSTCYLFHVFYIIKLPSIFVHLINHPKVRWSGVFIKNDFIKLKKDFNINVNGALSRIIDLGTYTNRILNFNSTFRWSMANLVKQLLKKDVNKDQNIRMGHWENTVLEYDQLMYASTDAYISLILYEHLRTLITRK